MLAQGVKDATTRIIADGFSSSPGSFFGWCSPREIQRVTNTGQTRSSRRSNQLESHYLAANFLLSNNVWQPFLFRRPYQAYRILPIVYCGLGDTANIAVPFDWRRIRELHLRPLPNTHRVVFAGPGCKKMPWHGYHRMVYVHSRIPPLDVVRSRPPG
jgi:hypothetical protein